MQLEKNIQMLEKEIEDGDKIAAQNNKEGAKWKSTRYELQKLVEENSKQLEKE